MIWMLLFAAGIASTLVLSFWAGRQVGYLDRLLEEIGERLDRLDEGDGVA